jgi:spore maturation protein CgeB
VPAGSLLAPTRRGHVRMKLVVFGLAISSSWGNGHATLWRGLCRALAARGHTVVFFERDVPYYAAHRDLWALPDGRLHLYSSWEAARELAEHELSGADVGMITSFCPDVAAFEDLLLESATPLRVYYDLDTPITLDRIARGEPVAYIGPHGLARYDLVLSYTGGSSLDRLCTELGARRALPLYGSVDPGVHQPVVPVDEYQADLSYIGTYSADRQEGVQRLFLEPARQLSDRQFVLAGSQYPDHFPWTINVRYKRHLTPDQHPAFYCSSRLTLNVTRRPMAETGFCPSGRLFEAAACGAPILSDWWPGLEQFFEPGREILVASSTAEAMAAIERPDDELREMAARARERTLQQHTADQRAAELEEILVSFGTGSTGRVGHHSSGGRGHADSAARLF